MYEHTPLLFSLIPVEVYYLTFSTPQTEIVRWTYRCVHNKGINRGIIIRKRTVLLKHELSVGSFKLHVGRYKMDSSESKFFFFDESLIPRCCFVAFLSAEDLFLSQIWSQLKRRQSSLDNYCETTEGTLMFRRDIRIQVLHIDYGYKDHELAAQWTETVYFAKIIDKNLVLVSLIFPVV